MKLLIKNGRVISAADGIDGRLDILIEDGRIVKLAKDIKESADSEINAENLVVSAGFCDLIARAHEPENDGEENMLSLCRAASRGGFTTLCLHSGATDIKQLQYIGERKEYCSCDIIPAVRATDGKELLNYGNLMLFSAGAAFDDEPVENPLLMRDALFRARKYGIPLFSRCKDKAFYQGGIARKGLMAELMDIPWIPACAESVMVARDVTLAEDTGSPVHIANVSTAQSVEIIRRAKKNGVPVTCSTAAHYISLTSRELQGFNTLAKLDPPLGNREDVEALIAGIADKTVDAVCSDHHPHSDESKRMSLLSAPYGASAVELTFPATLTALYHGAKMELSEVLALITSAPADILGINAGHIREGEKADLCIFDTEKEITVKGRQLISQGHNTPFEGKTLKGTVLYTIKDGRLTWQTA